MDRLIALRTNLANMSTASLDDYETAAEESCLSLYTSCIDNDDTIDNNKTLSEQPMSATDFNVSGKSNAFCQSNPNTVKKASPFMITQSNVYFATTNDESNIEMGIDKLEDSLPLDVAISLVANSEQKKIAENASLAENKHQSARNIVSIVVDSVTLENKVQTTIDQNLSLLSNECSLLSGTPETIVEVTPSIDIHNILSENAVTSKNDTEPMSDLNTGEFGAVYCSGKLSSQPEVSVNSIADEQQSTINFDENKENVGARSLPENSKSVAVKLENKYALRRSIVPSKSQPKAEKSLRQSLTSEFRKQMLKRPTLVPVVDRRITRQSIVAGSLAQIRKEGGSQKTEMIPGNL